MTGKRLSTIVMLGLAACGRATPVPTPTEMPTEILASSVPAPSSTATEAPPIGEATLAVTDLAPATEAATAPPTLTRAPTETMPPTATVPPTATPIESPDTSPVKQPLAVLVDDDAGQVILVDPTGAREDAVFPAPGLQSWGLFHVTSNYIFYYDADAQVLRRIDPFGENDAALAVLPLIGVDLSFTGSFLPAPNGFDVAFGMTDVVEGADFATVSRVVVSDMRGVSHTVLEQEWLEDQRLPRPVAWSPDGRYLYYTNQLWGVGGYILFWGGPDLWRVDLESGLPEAILPDMDCLCPLAVSPDGRYVAYINTHLPQLTLYVQQIESGETLVTHDLPEGIGQAGAITWKPDSTAFLYTEARGDFEAERYSIVLADLEGNLTYLTADDAQLRRSAVWFTGPLVGYVDDVGYSAWLVDINDPGAIAQLSVGQPWMEGRP